MTSSATLDDALGVLLGDSLAHVVDLVLCRRNGVVEAQSGGGACGISLEGRLQWERGANPLARQDASAFSPLQAELAELRPSNERNHYPYAYENAAQLFEDPRAPDVAVLHTPAHNWEERGGHAGEHGSLDVVQSRAPLIVSGTGIRRLGQLEAHARMVDVAPTICALLGVEPKDGAVIRGQRGRVLDEVLDPAARPERVVAFLCDGTNANVLYALAAAGELPNFARLMAEGTVYGHGLMASFPSATLANHTTALTGLPPGAHGVLHNAYYDRATARQIITNAPETWHLAREELSPRAETVFEAVARSGGGFTAAVDEPVDRGASYSTFDFLRTGMVTAVQNALVDPTEVPGATAEFVDAKRDYAWASSADHMAVMQATSLWRGEAGNPRPRFLWVNLILPDAANHSGGPHSNIGRAGLRDTDRRLGDILDAMDWGGGETAFVLLADHGMEQTDPECKGDFDEALSRARIPFRDEAYGFIYLGEPS